VIPLDMTTLDRDGALAEAEAGLSRGRFLGLGALAGAGLLLGRAGSARAAFYTEAQRANALKGRAAEAAQVVGAVERAHVKAFRALLGAKAIKKPRFDFQGVTEDQKKFLKTAVAFEDLAVEAYKGQAVKIRSDAVLASALGIHTVEARHAAWMRYLNGIQPAVRAFDSPRPRSEIDVVVRKTGFVVAAPRMTARKRRPKYTG